MTLRTYYDEICPFIPDTTDIIQYTMQFPVLRGYEGLILHTGCLEDIAKDARCPHHHPTSTFQVHHTWLVLFFELYIIRLNS